MSGTGREVLFDPHRSDQTGQGAQDGGPIGGLISHVPISSSVSRI